MSPKGIYRRLTACSLGLLFCLGNPQPVQASGFVTLDTKVQWKTRMWVNSQGYVMVEVSNLFDQVINTKTSELDAFSDTYTPGRKIWLEVGMRF